MAVYVGYDDLKEFIDHLDWKAPVYLMLLSRRWREQGLPFQEIWVQIAQVRSDAVHYFYLRLFENIAPQDKDKEAKMQIVAQQVYGLLRERLGPDALTVSAKVHLPKDVLLGHWDELEYDPELKMWRLSAPEAQSEAV